MANYYPNGKGGYSVYDDDWNQIDNFPARATPMRKIMSQFPLGQATIPTGASGQKIGAALGSGLNSMMGAGRNRDTETIKAEPGEYVIRKDAAQTIGYDNLDALNNINRTTYGPGSPGATSADMREYIGSYDNPLRQGDIAVHPQSGIRAGPESYLNIGGDRYHVADYTHPRVPRNTIDFYYPGGAGQPQRYQDGGAVEPPRLPGNRRPVGRDNFGRGVGGLEFDIGERGRGMAGWVRGGGPMGLGPTDLALYGGGGGGFNPFFPWSKAKYAEGGVVGDYDEYRIGGRVGGRRPRGYRPAARRNAMMAYEGIGDNRFGSFDPREGPGRSTPSQFFPPGNIGDLYEPPFPSYPRMPSVPPPAYTDTDTENPTNPGLGYTGGYDRPGGYEPGMEGPRGLSGFPGISGAGGPTQTENALYGIGRSIGDYVIPFWVNQS